MSTARTGLSYQAASPPHVRASAYGGRTLVSPPMTGKTVRRRGLGADLSRLPRAQREQIYRRRRAAALALAVVGLLLVMTIASSGGGGSAAAGPDLLQLPRGGREIL